MLWMPRNAKKREMIQWIRIGAGEIVTRMSCKEEGRGSRRVHLERGPPSSKCHSVPHYVTTADWKMNFSSANLFIHHNWGWKVQYCLEGKCHRKHNVCCIHVPDVRHLLCEAHLSDKLRNINTEAGGVCNAPFMLLQPSLGQLRHFPGFYITTLFECNWKFCFVAGMV